MIRTFIIDDHDLVRTGIRRILDAARGIQVVGEAGTGEEGLQRLRELTPDVILVDIEMPGIGGLETTRRVRRLLPRAGIVILTMHAGAPFPTRLLEAGASGYLTKGCSADELIKAVQSVERGERYIGEEIAQQLALSLLPGQKRSPFQLLSDRETEVMVLLVRGLEIADIAQQLSLSPKTISTYKARLYEKLMVGNDVELTHMALRHGVVRNA